MPFNTMRLTAIQDYPKAADKVRKRQPKIVTPAAKEIARQTKLCWKLFAADKAEPSLYFLEYSEGNKGERFMSQASINRRMRASARGE